MSDALLLSMTSFALNAAWQAGIVTLAALALERRLGGVAPRWRHWFWLVVCALVLLVPLATAGLTAVSQPAQATAGLEGAGAPTKGAWTLERTRLQVPVAVVLQWLAAGLIAVGALASAARLMRGLFSLLSLRSRKQAEVPPEVKAIAELCAMRLDLHREVALCGVEGLAGPVTYGAFRPVILIPAQLCLEPDKELLMAVFGHEMGHIRRNDFLLNLGCEAVLLPLAWHPAAGWIRGRLAVTREAACDELVAGLMADRKRYARSLLRIASAPFETAPGLGMSDGGELEQRIRNLMSRPVQGGWPRFAGSAASIVLTAILASCGMVKAVAPPFKVEPKTLAGDWVGRGMGYQFLVSFTERGPAVSGQVDVVKLQHPKPEPPRFEFRQLGEPPTVIAAIPPPPPPPPPPWIMPDSGGFGNTLPGKGGIAFRVGGTNYLIAFDAFGDGRLKAMKNGRLPEFNIALRKARPTK